MIGHFYLSGAHFYFYRPKGRLLASVLSTPAIPTPGVWTRRRDRSRVFVAGDQYGVREEVLERGGTGPVDCNGKYKFK